MREGLLALFHARTLRAQLEVAQEARLAEGAAAASAHAALQGEMQRALVAQRAAEEALVTARHSVGQMREP